MTEVTQPWLTGMAGSRLLEKVNTVTELAMAGALSYYISPYATPCRNGTTKHLNSAKYW
jgi:hypothetical protein